MSRIEKRTEALVCAVTVIIAAVLFWYGMGSP